MTNEVSPSNCHFYLAICRTNTRKLEGECSRRSKECKYLRAAGTSFPSNKAAQGGPVGGPLRPGGTAQGVSQGSLGRADPAVGLEVFATSKLM